MKLVKVSAAPPENFLEYQSPKRLGEWGGYRFTTDPAIDECDFFIPDEVTSVPQSVWCRTGHAILITAEPPTIRHYGKKYLSQFSAVVCPDPSAAHAHLFLGQQGIAWHAGWSRDASGARVGALDYDAFVAMSPPLKPRRMSVVCSAKTITDGHRQRLRFVERLKTEFGEELEWFGNGIRPLQTKWDALAPFKYHLTLENCCVPHYWSEKLADAYLGWCLPIYCGCTNISDYFPTKSFELIDRGDFSGSVATIRPLLERDLYPGRVEAIHEARRRVLEHYNFLAVAARVLDTLKPQRPRRITIWPEKDFSDPLWKRVGRRGRRWARLAV